MQYYIKVHFAFQKLENQYKMNSYYVQSKVHLGQKGGRAVGGVCREGGGAVGGELQWLHNQSKGWSLKGVGSY